MKRYILSGALALSIFMLAACSEEAVGEGVEMKAFVEEHGQTGLTKEQVVEAFGDAAATGEIGGEEVWLYDNGANYERSFTEINTAVFTEDMADYQLYISFVNDLAYRYSYIYENDEEVWQLQLLPGGEDPLHTKVPIQ